MVQNQLPFISQINVTTIRIKHEGDFASQQSQHQGLEDRNTFSFTYSCMSFWSQHVGTATPTMKHCSDLLTVWQVRGEQLVKGASASEAKNKMKTSWLKFISKYYKLVTQLGYSVIFCSKNGLLYLSQLTDQIIQWMATAIPDLRVFLCVLLHGYGRVT